ncbi:MAG: hypothetical protein IT259_11095 [Saprospiraceae bacterium]|nr:hypothetical protein [Saprospiraceae bacterium]
MRYFPVIPLLLLFLSGCDSVIGTTDTCYVSHDRVIYACDLDGPATTVSTLLSEEDKLLTVNIMEATSGNYRLNLGAVNGCDGQVEVVVAVNGTEIENSVQQTLPKTLSFAVQGIQPVSIRLRPRSLDDNCLCPDPDLGGSNGEFQVGVLIKKL